MNSSSASDIFVTGFNTPEWSGNFSFGNREIIKNVGFNIVYKWQQSFLWESPLVTGSVPSVNTVDAQVSFKLPAYKSVIKIGGTDIFNKRYIQYAGGPTLGALYYASIIFDAGSIKK